MERVSSGKSVSPTYAQIVDDYTTANMIYICEAVVGSLSSAPVWRIKRVDQASGFVTTWADGNAEFDNVADDRASLSYS